MIFTLQLQHGIPHFWTATPVLANVSFMPRTNKLAGELGKFKMGADSAFLTKLTRAIFSQHLDKYME